MHLSSVHLLTAAAALRAPFPLACQSPPLFAEDLNLIIDGKCGICQWEKDNLRSLGADGKITFTDLEDDYDAAAARNGGVTYADGMAKITAVTRDGSILQGMEVFAACYERVGLGWIFAALEWPVVGPLIETAYNIFATVRTDITRGQSLEALIEANAKRSSGSSRASVKMSAAFDWSGFEQSCIDGLARPLLVCKGSKGFAACGYIDVATTDKLGEACVIFTGVNTCDDFLESDVVKVSEAAAALGCTVGMRGSDAMELLR